MSVVKICLIVAFLIVAVALLVLCLIQADPNEQPSDNIIESGADSFYSKNKKKTAEGKREIAIIVLAVLFVVLIIASIFVK